MSKTAKAIAQEMKREESARTRPVVKWQLDLGERQDIIFSGRTHQGKAYEIRLRSTSRKQI